MAKNLLDQNKDFQTLPAQSRQKLFKYIATLVLLECNSYQNSSFRQKEFETA
jgi:hypothetical protein